MKDSLSLLTGLIESALKAGATAADALLFESSSLSVSHRMRNPEGLERSENSGISLRVFSGNRTAVVSSSDTGRDTLAELVSRAVAMARLAPEDKFTALAPESMLAGNVPELDLYDAKEPETKWLQEQCRKAEDAALSVKGITNSEGADAGFGTSRFTLATSNSFAKFYQTSNISLSVAVLAGEGTAMERDYDYSSVRFVSDLADAASIGKKAATLALARLNPRKVKTQQVPVVFDPRGVEGAAWQFRQRHQRQFCSARHEFSQK